MLTLRYLPMKARHVIAIATNCTVCRVAPARRIKGGVALLPTPPTARHLQCKSGEGAREGAREGTKFAALRGYSKLGFEQVQDCGVDGGSHETHQRVMA